MDNIKIKRWICDILLFLCFTAIAFFAGKILINQWKYKKAQKEYDTLQKAVQTEKSINWKKLKRINKDIVAWMKVPGCKKDFMSDNNVIYGHHMRDGSMFATFVKYKNRSFWKKHQKIILYLPKETRTLKVIAARANKPEKLPIEFKNKKDRENYLSRIQSISYLPDQSIRKRLYTFVTCSYEKNDYRTYIYAVENQKEVRE